MEYTEYTVACALKCGNNNIWMSERLDTSNFAGYWQFAGGKCGKNENPIDAAKREVKEETNLDIDVNLFRYLSQIIGDPSTKTCFVYYVDLNADQIPVRTENLNSDWVLLSYEQALSKHLMPGLVESINNLKREKIGTIFLDSRKRWNPLH